METTLAMRRKEIVRLCTETAKRVGRGVLFGMQTSLMLQSIPVPFRCDLRDSVLHTVVRPEGKRIRGRDLQAHVWKRYERGAFVRVNQYVYALDAVHVWAQLSPHVPFEELIVLTNSVITALSGNSGDDAADVYARMTDFLELPVRFTGIRNCRLALRLCLGGIRSPMESRTYLTLMSHGLPVPQINAVVPGVMFRSNVPMTVDLAWAEQKVAVEYDGDQHRTDKMQWRRDQEKRELLRSRGWIVVIVTADDLRDADARAALAFRVARYLAKRGARFDFSVEAMSLSTLAKRNGPIW
ncbi:DUF559 domain-containing protein [Bifidobacterium sp. SMB2]|uniref:DUF559 domain-containing protein n=2 Tax=Bifidobacterium TaxID=1678 RepID=A0ABX0CBY8_9BIFI|nr:DUF559 domain-containing protein [Bifidobacterium sp. SMB2]NEH11967.1 DUF559 domain-containing protein [Bifidobacterium saimiriisciurei]